MKTENQWVVCSNVDALNGGYISLSEEGLPLMNLSYCFIVKKEKKKKEIFIKLVSIFYIECQIGPYRYLLNRKI